jgi:uncharacterized protein (TIGR03546 family)
MVEIATTRTRKSFVEHLTQHRSPSAIAAGTSFGVALGLIPKDTLLALVLMLAILLLSVNQIAACVFAIGLSLLSGWTIGFTHAFGTLVLQSDLIASFIVSLYQIPLIPWFRLENTVVTGGIALGAFLWLPTFLLALRFCNKVREIIRSEQIAELAAASIRHRRHLNAGTFGHSHDRKLGFLAMTERNTIEQRSENAEAKPAELSLPQTSFTMDLATSDEVTRVEANCKPIAQKLDSIVDDTVLRETLIEVVRYKQPRREKPEIVPPITHHNLNPMKLAIPANAEAVSTPRSSDTNIKFHSPNTGASHVMSNSSVKEESLRHILKHIHGSREARKETGKPA